MQASFPLPAAPRRRAAPLPELVWRVFLVWTAIGFVVMPLGIDGEAVDRWLLPGAARQASNALLHVSDAVWIYLAAVVVYLHTAAVEGLTTARRRAVVLLVGSGCLEWIGARTGYPFGPYRYTDNFGWRIGGVVPVAIPLAWLVVILCARSLVLRWRAASTRTELALGVALLATLTDVNLEAVAWKVRGYWLWYPDAAPPLPAWPPWQNYVSWFGASFALAYLLPRNDALRPRDPFPGRLPTMLGLMNALFVVVYLARWLRLRT